MIAELPLVLVLRPRNSRAEGEKLPSPVPTLSQPAELRLTQEHALPRQLKHQRRIWPAQRPQQFVQPRRRTSSLQLDIRQHISPVNQIAIDLPRLAIVRCAGAHKRTVGFNKHPRQKPKTRTCVIEGDGQLKRPLAVVRQRSVNECLKSQHFSGVAFVTQTHTCSRIVYELRLCWQVRARNELCRRISRSLQMRIQLLRCPGGTYL